MEEIKKQELNKKLAGIGFKWYEPLKGFLTPECIPDLLEPDELNFTESLDACFKWLVPEATKRFGAWSVYSAACNAMYEAIEKKEFSTKKALYNGKPALALCLAIEKLIDSEAKGNADIKRD